MFCVIKKWTKMKKWQVLQNLTSEQSTTSKDRGCQHTDMSGGDGRSGLCESTRFHTLSNAFKRFQTLSLLPESILDLIRSLLFMSFKDISPGFRNYAWVSKERERVFCVCVWLRCLSPSVGVPGLKVVQSLCDLLELATVLTWHLQRSGQTTKTDNFWEISTFFIR